MPMDEPASSQKQMFGVQRKTADIREGNIAAGKSVSDAIRTSLGPRGMDKMIVNHDGDVMITNDGATILKKMHLVHPIGKMLASLSRAQDSEAGDGTTTVVILAGCLLEAASGVLSNGVHPTVVSESFTLAASKAVEVLTDMSIGIDLEDRTSLLKSAMTALSSKVVSQNSECLANIAVDAVMKVMKDNDANIDDVHIHKKLGGTLDDTSLVDGFILDHDVAGFGGPNVVENANIALIQFWLSAPKTDIEHSVVISDYTQLDRALREERQYILGMVRDIKKAGCNVLLVQKSILREATTELALQMLAKAKIMVIRDIDRSDVDEICRALGCIPIASIDHFKAHSFARADLVERIEGEAGGKRMVKFSGLKRAIGAGHPVSIIVRGSNRLVLDEAERSLHDALCVVRCLVKQQALIVGGGAPEIEMAVKLHDYALNHLEGAQQYAVRAFSDSLETIPYTLAENAGLNAVEVVTALRGAHVSGNKNVGISVRRHGIGNMLDESVIQPLLCSTSAISLATEAVTQILKIDGVLLAERLG
ncbi:hypothetical protein ACOME3_009095 [Neoechinorhynchus agilis]